MIYRTATIYLAEGSGGACHGDLVEEEERHEHLADEAADDEDHNNHFAGELARCECVRRSIRGRGRQCKTEREGVEHGREEKLQQSRNLRPISSDVSM